MKRIQKVDQHFSKQSDIFYDKIKFSKELKSHGIRVPEVYAVMNHEGQWDAFWEAASKYDTLVVKPNRLSRGRSVHIIEKTDNPNIWVQADGSKVARDFIRAEALGIVNHRKTWCFFAEERIFCNDWFNTYKYGKGIVDFRIYMLDDNVLYAKMRCPSKQSGGLANTSKHGIAMFVKNGVITSTDKFKNCTVVHPDIKIDRTGTKIPFWKDIEATAVKVAKIFSSPFHSVDLTVNEDGEVVVIEAEKIPTLGHFSIDEAKYLYDEIGVWMKDKLFKEMR